MCYGLRTKSANITYYTCEKNTKTLIKSEFYGTKLCVNCQNSFDLIYKHRFVVHSHRVQGSSNYLITDNTYQSHVKKFLSDSTEKSINNSKFWNDPYYVSKHYKYCRHCRIYYVKEEQSKEYMECSENLRVRVNDKTSFNFMTTYVNDMMFFNITKDMGLYENR